MVRLFKHYIPYAVLLLGLLDVIALGLAAETGWRLRTWQIGTDAGIFANRVLEITAFAGIGLLALVSVGGYGPDALRSIRVAAARLLVALGLAVVGISLVAFLAPGADFWRSVLLYAVAIAMALVLLSRGVTGRMLGTSNFDRRIVVMGAGARAKRIERLAAKPRSGVKVAAFIDMGDGPAIIPDAVMRASISDLDRFVERLQAGEVVLALEERRNALPLKDLLRIKTRGLAVTDLTSFLERETGRVDLDTLNPSWLIFSDGFVSGQAVAAAGKRIFDLVSSACLLLITAPIILVFAILVRLETAGPAFFRQQRVGLYGIPFELVKLRSMCCDAEADGSKWASVNDPRITRVGRWIRKFRIDELPQLWLVLRGRMSFVGPRPEVPQFVATLDQDLPFYAERHMVKPGITGWAQINYPYGASLQDARHKLEYDLYYAKNYSPFLDILILLQTVRVILWPSGAR